MPGFNGTGPNGQGPLTGGGRGPCGQGQAYGRGFGRGFAHGYGRGHGRGFGSGYGQGRQGWASAQWTGAQWPETQWPGAAEMEERLARLEAENQELRDRLKQQS